MSSQGSVLSCAALEWCRLATSSSEMQRKSIAAGGGEKDMRCEEMRSKAKEMRSEEMQDKAKERQVDIKM